MKKILLTLIMAVGMVTLANAKDKEKSYCELSASLAEAIMSRRQEGVPMSKILAIFSDSDPFDKNSVIKAYSLSRYDSEKFQQSAIADFRDQRHVDCLKLINQ